MSTISWSMLFFVLAAMCAVFGFTGVAEGAAEFAKILFVVFFVIFLVTMVAGLIRRP